MCLCVFICVYIHVQVCECDTFPFSIEMSVKCTCQFDICYATQTHLQIANGCAVYTCMSFSYLGVGFIEKFCK